MFQTSLDNVIDYVNGKYTYHEPSYSWFDYVNGIGECSFKVTLARYNVVL